MNIFAWIYENDWSFPGYTDVLVVRAHTLNQAREIVAKSGDERAIELSLERPEVAMASSDAMYFNREYRYE